jgi:double-strand break repair protein MRE11
MSKDKQHDEDEGVGPTAEDTLRVMIATDNHLGYMEKDPIRGNDSFVTFEEILQQARKNKVDFLLLGGDLFHENKPSRSCMYKTMELLRKYCFGDRPVQFHLLSDPKVNFATRFGTVNYEDPNFNIDLPIFSIHGNHDDPAGDGGLAALDLLSVVNFVNYFGKNDNIDDVTLKPILIQKGITKLALYGMGNIRDERLYRTFQQKKVKLLRPSEDRDSWFNLFVLHQNRVAHSPKNYVHEEMIDNFLNFILWGHEHECVITPQQSVIGEFFISQPGSSVATSLSEGEAKPKYIGIMEIYQDKFRLNPIPLTTVRPFIIDDVVLSEQPGLKPENSNLVNEFLVSKVEEMIKEAEETSKSKEPLKPLIRLRVDYTGFSPINPARFGQRFVGRVANANEILHFTRKRPKTEGGGGGGRIGKVIINGDELMSDLKPDPLDETSIEDLVKKCFRQTSTRMEILPEYDLNVALHNFVEKDDKHAIAEYAHLLFGPSLPCVLSLSNNSS